MTEEFDKEAFVGVPGRTCRYTGDAERGLQIQLSPEDVFTINAEQIRAIFAALATHNPLDDESYFFRRIQNRKHVVRRLFKRLLPAPHASRMDAYARLVLPRFWSWLKENSATVFGRTLNEEHAACIQGVFGGEGLLPMSGAVPEDFPTADVASAAQALVGRTVVYEEAHRLVAVRVIHADADFERDFLTLHFENLELPGFFKEFPKDFSAGGQISSVCLNSGELTSGMGIWHITTGPGSVQEVLSLAAKYQDPRAFLTAHRRLLYGRGFLEPRPY